MITLIILSIIGLIGLGVALIGYLREDPMTLLIGLVVFVVSLISISFALERADKLDRLPSPIPKDSISPY